MTLAALDVAGRLPRLRAALGRHKVDALACSSLVSIRYLTGFTGSAGLLFVLDDEAVLVTDGRYATQAPREIEAAGAGVRVEVAPSARQAAAARSVAAGVKRIGLEAADITWARVLAFGSDWFPGVELVPTQGLVEGLRLVKDDGELARLAEAARVADAALASVRGMLADAPTEEELGRALDFEMRRLGASGPSFDTIVACGPNAAQPHHRAGTDPIRAGQPVVLDFGARYEGYCSDMTRTVWVDSVEDPELRKIIEVVGAAQAAGVARVRAGVACADVDRACREVIEEAGLGDRFVHLTGHGVGLEIHEAPTLGPDSTATLAPGHVVTVEPGVYLPGAGGARIEDTVVVTEDGSYPLTLTSKDSI